MELELPLVPAGVVTLLGFFAPYAVALVNHPRWSTGSKRLVSVAVSVILATIGLVLYYVITGDEIPSIPMLLLLSVTVAQTSYGLVLKTSAKTVEENHGTH